MVDKIKELCKQRNINVYQLEQILGFGGNTIYRWNKRTPGIDKLMAVADYFNVSTDYLLGRTENPAGATELPVQLTVDEAFSLLVDDKGKPLTKHDIHMLKALFKTYIEQRDKE